MSVDGHSRRFWLGAGYFRSSPNNGHCQTGLLGPVGAKLGSRRFIRSPRSGGRLLRTRRDRTARPVSIKRTSRDSERQSLWPDRRRRASLRPCGGVLDNRGNIRDRRASTRLALQPVCPRRCHQLSASSAPATISKSCGNAASCGPIKRQLFCATRSNIVWETEWTSSSCD